MTKPGEYKNIVVIGASIGGHEVINQLMYHLPEEYRILLIDARRFTWYPITILRAVVVPGWEDKVSIPLTTNRVFKRNTTHHVIAPNRVVGLREQSIILEEAFEGSVEVPFWRCVIATGASQEIPSMPGWTQSQEEFIESLRESQREIQESEKIVVVGGGAVGIEIAGEIAAHHPSKSITLIHKDIGLLSPSPTPSTSSMNEKISKGGMERPSYSSPPTDLRLSIELEKICEKLGIKFILSDRVIVPSASSSSSSASAISRGAEKKDDESARDPVNREDHNNLDDLNGSNKDIKEWDGKFGKQKETVSVKLKSGKTLEADYIYPGCGMRPNSQIVRDVDKEALDGDLIRVDKYLKVISTSEDTIFKGQYYAIGDCCSCPGFKIAHGALWGAQNTASNIINEIRGKSSIEYNIGSMAGLTVPLGPNEGAGMVIFGWLGTWVFGSWWTTTFRGKTSGTERHFAGRFKGDKKVEIKF